MVDGVIFQHLVIIFFVGEGEGKHPLFLKVGLVDTRKTSYDDRTHAEMTGFHGRMFAGGAFAIVLVADHHGADSRSLVCSRAVAGTGPYSPVSSFFTESVSFVEEIHGARSAYYWRYCPGARGTSSQGTSHGDMIGGTLSLSLDQEASAP